MQNRFDLLTTIGLARAYLQAEYDRHRQHPFWHPGDKACTIAHWTGLARKCRDWHPAPVRLP